MPIDENELFQERILEHYEEPYHRGDCENCTHSHEDRNPLCGDVIRMSLQIDDGGRFREVFFDGSGCCISQAAASMLVEKFDGRTVEEVRKFTAEDMLALFGAKLTPNRQKCCLLPWRVLQAAIFSPVDQADATREPPPIRPAATDVSRSTPLSAPPVRTASTAPPLDPAKYRPDFPILARTVHGQVPLVYLDNAATTQRPRQVIQAIVAAYEESYANVHRGIHTLAEESTALYEAARTKVAELLHAGSPQQIVFTRGATEAVNLVARTWGDANVRAGDRIVVTEMEHHSNLVPWQQLAERTGAVLRAVPLSDDGRLQLEALDRLLEERPKLVAVTAVSNVLGTINPVDEMIRRSHDAGALVLVDGAQSVPHQPTDVAASDADFLVFSGHKMLGPSGIGALYGKQELLEAMPPFMGGGHMIEEVRLTSFRPSREVPDRFEPGTPPIVPAIALAAAIDYLLTVGLDAIQEHEARLVERAHRLLGRIEGLRILGPEPAWKAGIVSFTFDSGEPHPHDIAAELDKRGIAVRAGHHCAMPLHLRYQIPASTRASFYLYNTEQEVDSLAAALDEVRHFFRRRR